MSKQSRSPYAQARWQRWEMDAFELPPDPNAPAPEPEVDLEAVLKEVAELKELAQQQGQAEGYAEGFQKGQALGQEQGNKSGYETGYSKGTEKGYAEGYEKGSSTAQAEAARLRDLANSTASSLTTLHESVGQAVLALAVDIAQHILQAELKHYPEHVVSLIKEVLQDTEQSDQAVTILIHPDDLALVQQHLHEDLQYNNWRLKADENISAGGVEVKTSLGHIDATLQTRWRRALSRLGPSAPKSL